MDLVETIEQVDAAWGRINKWVGYGKPLALADEWECKHGPLNFDGKVESFRDENDKEISRVAFAFKLAEWQLKKQGKPIRQGSIEISFSFCAEWGIDTEHERTIREMCSAWLIDGGEPRSLMANYWGGAK